MPKTVLIKSSVVLFFVLFLSTPLLSQDAEDCLMCHSDPELTMERGDKEISIFVDADSYEESVHGIFSCVDCHMDFSTDELPHKEGSNIYEVDCSMCHDTETFDESIHGKNNVSCFGCHTKHAIEPADDFLANSYKQCLDCHTSRNVREYTSSAHFSAFKSNRGGPSCKDCHNGGGHEIQSVHFSAQELEVLCTTCHTKLDRTPFVEQIHNTVKESSTIVCTNCHGSHRLTVTQFGESEQFCITCHLNEDFFKPEDTERLVEYPKHFQNSVHAKAREEGKKAATCEDCHGNHIEIGLEAAHEKLSRENLEHTCGACHTEVMKEYEQSSHGQAFLNGVDVAPMCTDCHGEHTISAVTDPAFDKLKRKEVCMDCHVDNPKVVAMMGSHTTDIVGYEQSAHWRALEDGNEKAPVCSDCHGGHIMKPASDPNSNINKHRVGLTCGQASDCHLKEYREYSESIHKTELDAGVEESPTCIDCHGNHQVMHKDELEIAGSHNRYVSKLCSDCHNSVELIEKTGLPNDKADSYYSSYHGLAVEGGSKTAANCASCHEYHDVKPSTDPTSSIHPDNLDETCGSCHPGAVIQGDFIKVHRTGEKEESTLLYYLEFFYFWLVVVIIGGMLIHNILDLIRKSQFKRENKEKIAELKKSGKYYIRMSKNERIQHFILLTSFFGLVITGFGLSYPDAFWVKGIRAVLGDGAFELRSLLHRIFGIIMIAISLYHTIYLFFFPRGRKMLIDMLPNLDDLKDLIVNIKYLIGLSKEHPHFGRFTYMEKAEYWALVWGTFVMGATGLMLMFNNYFLANYAKIVLDISGIIHFYEAWLAFLAIVVWHFYYVIFNPIVYPINGAFFHGKISEELMALEHPKELDKVKREQQKKDVLGENE